jgi:UPF0176 protein
MNPSVSITASYAFIPFTEEEAARLQEELWAFGNERQMKGLVLIAKEGINSTVCGSVDAIAAWKERLKKLDSEIVFKDSEAEGLVFRRWSVKIKPEIVAIKQSHIHPQGKHRALPPDKWNEMMQKEDVIVIDSRNDYEVAIGKFRGAIDPLLKKFHEFPEYVKNAAIPKEKKVLLYCTGGIRCEKAVLAMEAEGYQDVYQLEGGILAYLEKFPHENFEGECFVFDHRVAVDQKLQPSHTYCLCKKCGNPADISDSEGDARGIACQSCAAAVSP